MKFLQKLQINFLRGSHDRKIALPDYSDRNQKEKKIQFFIGYVMF